MRGWGDGDTTLVGRHPSVERSGEPEGGDKETRGQGDKEKLVTDDSHPPGEQLTTDNW